MQEDIDPDGAGGDPDPTTDHHVHQVRAGDHSSFAALHERIAPSLEAWARLRVGGSLCDFVEPGDIVQEVSWRAMDSFARHDPERSKFRPWLFKIATNALLEWNRKRRRRARLDPVTMAERARALPPALGRQATSVGREVAMRDSVVKLVEVVGEMCETDRAAFVNCEFEGRTAAHTAVLASPSQTARRAPHLAGVRSGVALMLPLRS
ncbi:MAG: sigma-70 family RNA polymerase sigma factor [Planctomycetes bacterium]|nr:sigma-70 family RNA polymerase sigma factor [Planctomycetota bacterium]